jgi:hypothetical protein
MVPLGFHWVPHGPTLRTASGGWFALGLVELLSLLPAARAGFAPAGTAPWRSRLQVACTVACVLVVPLAAAHGGPRTAAWLTGLGLLGALGLGGLTVANLWLLLKSARGRQAAPAGTQKA